MDSDEAPRTRRSGSEWLIPMARVLGAWLVAFAPATVYGQHAPPLLLFPVQVLVVGLIIGFGRRALDALAVESVSAAFAFGLATVASFDPASARCTAPLQCFRAEAGDVLLVSFVLVFPVALVALTVAVIRERSLGGLWNRTRIKPVRLWQWLLLGAGVVTAIPLLGVADGVPWPP